MTDINIHDLNANSVPFFARYLEGQSCQDLSPEEINAIQGGAAGGKPGIDLTTNAVRDGLVITNAFPSDGDSFAPNLIPLQFTG